MIPATKPASVKIDKTYDLWTPTSINITYVAPGKASASVTITRSRDVGGGATELAPSSLDGRSVGFNVSDIYGPVSTGGAEIYPQAVKDLVLAAVTPLMTAVAALAQARQSL